MKILAKLAMAAQQRDRESTITDWAYHSVTD